MPAKIRTMRPLLVALFIMPVALAAPALSNNDRHARADEGQEQAIAVVDIDFDPADVTVMAGTTVIWTNMGARQHNVTSLTGDFHSGRLTPGESFSFTFTGPGVFYYQCTVHWSQSGTVWVTATDETE